MAVNLRALSLTTSCFWWKLENMKMMRMSVCSIAFLLVFLPVMCASKRCWRKIISTPLAPAPANIAYSQGVRVGQTIYVSAQAALDSDRQLVSEDVGNQTIQALRNIEIILNAAGGKLADVVKTTVYLKDVKDLAIVNVGYETVFRKNFPARAAFQVASLPGKGNIEIEAIAVL